MHRIYKHINHFTLLRLPFCKLDVNLSSKILLSVDVQRNNNYQVKSYKHSSGKTHLSFYIFRQSWTKLMQHLSKYHYTLHVLHPHSPRTMLFWKCQLVLCNLQAILRHQRTTLYWGHGG